MGEAALMVKEYVQVAAELENQKLDKFDPDIQAVQAMLFPPFSSLVSYKLCSVTA